jgi:hypothetical protein
MSVVKFWYLAAARNGVGWWEQGGRGMMQHMWGNSSANQGVMFVCLACHASACLLWQAYC